MDNPTKSDAITSDTSIKEVKEIILQLEAIVEESQDAIIGETLDGIITSWNGGATKIFGYSAEEMIGKSVSLLLPQENKDEMLQILNKIRAGEVIADRDSVKLRKDGSKIEIAHSISPIHANDGTIIGASVVERDITERKQNETRIQHMAQLYAALSKCNKAVVHCTNEDELFQQVCSVAVQFGGMTMAWIGIVDEASKKVKPVASFGTGTEYLNGIQISVEANDPLGHGPTGISIRENRPVWCQDFQNNPMTAMWHERGESVGWLSSASLPLVRNGVPVGNFTIYSNVINSFDNDAQKLLIEMASDISFALDNFFTIAKQKKSEELLLSANHKIFELQKTKDEFVSIAAHQLRSPINTIAGFTSLLKDQGSFTADQKESIETIEKSAKQMKELVNFLLKITRAETGGTRLELSSVNLKAITENIIEIIGNDLNTKNQTVEIKQDPSPFPDVFLDEDMIKQVILNLLSNANRYSPNDSIIKVSMVIKDLDVEFSVKDSGIGIAKEVQGKIFEKFFRADNARIMVSEGTGLGLALVKSLVEVWGGKIWFESEENKGTTFYFLMPVLGKKEYSKEVVL